jgi:hypothetical protein
MSNYEHVWEDYLKDNYFPIYVRDVKEIHLEEFTDIVLNHRSYAEELILDFLAGDVFIIKNALSKEVAESIREDVYEWGENTPEQNLKADSLVPNFHYTSLESGSGDGYSECAHSYFFWRWNPDDLKIFEKLNHYWDIIKIFNGLGQDGLKDNTPEDKIVDRVQILNYPLNVGKITPHCDVARWQKTNVAISITEKGTHYSEGGLYCLNAAEEEVEIESRIQTGDSILWLPSIFHGVHEPTGDKSNADHLKGRWQLLAQVVQSWKLKNRVISVSYENFKKDPEKILDSYVFREGL